MTKLKELRKAAGLTRVQLFDRTGIPIRTLEAYEQGLRPLTRAKLPTVLRICGALNCRPEDLID